MIAMTTNNSMSVKAFRFHSTQLLKDELYVRLIHPFGKPELAIKAYPAGNPEGNTYRTQSINTERINLSDSQ